MVDGFDPYHKWLGIPPAEQPPNHYRLLGIALFEDDLDVIASASDRQMSHLRTFQTSKYSAESQRLLNDIAAARVCLLHRDRKRAYDEKLHAVLEPPEPSRVAPSTISMAPIERVTMLPPRAAQQAASNESPVDGSSQAPLRRWLKPAIAAAVVVVIWTVVGARWLFWGAEAERPPLQPPRPTANNPPAVPVQPKTPVVPPQVAPPQVTPLQVTPPTTVVRSTVAPQPPLNLAIGDEFDLLQVIDPVRDRSPAAMAWTVKQGKLTAPALAPGILRLPKPPLNYTLSADITNPEYFTLGLVAAGHPFLVECASGGVTLSNVDGKRLATGPPEWDWGTRPATISCSVRGNWIRIVANGQRMFDWTGDTQRLSRAGFDEEDPARLFVFATNESRLTRLSIKRHSDAAGVDDSIAPEARFLAVGQQVDVLKLMDLERDIISGGWLLGTNSLTATKYDSKIYLPVPNIPNYVLTAQILRPSSGRPTIRVVFPLGAAAGFFSFEHQNLPCTFYHPSFSEPEKLFRQGTVLQPDASRTIEYKVHGNRFVVAVDQKPIFDWTNPDPKLEGQPTVRHRDKIMIWSEKDYRITRLTFKNVPESEEPAPQAAPAVVDFPAATVAVQERAAEPDEAARTEARARIRGNRADEFAKARSPKEQTALAHRLLSEHRFEKDIVGVYAILAEAHDLAVEAGNVDLAMETIGKLAYHFKIERTAWEVKSCSDLSKQIHNVNERTSLLKKLLQLFNDALREENLDLAQQLASQAQVEAVRVPDSDLRRQVLDGSAELKKKVNSKK